jgi:hypothetical protein
MKLFVATGILFLTLSGHAQEKMSCQQATAIKSFESQYLDLLESLKGEPTYSDL